MNLNRPKGPDPNDGPPKGGDFDAHLFAGVLAELEQFEHGADPWALISAIEGIIGRSGPRILNAEQRARLIAAIDRAEAAAFKHLELFDPELVDHGFAALRFAADAWARPPLSRQARELAGPAETRRQADAAAHSKILLNEISTEALRRRLSERAAAAVRTPASPEAHATLSELDMTLSTASEYFERVARGEDPVSSAVLGLRLLIARLDESSFGVLFEAANPEALDRLGAAMSVAIFPLAEAVGPAIQFDTVALGMGCANALVGRLSTPTGVPVPWSTERLVCSEAHCRVLVDELDALQQQRAINAAGNVVFRAALVAHLWRRAERAAVLH